jgi:hypothetical protein
MPQINSSIKKRALDRKKIQQVLDTCISHLTADEHPQELVNIVTGKLAAETVNTDKALGIGSREML